MNENTKQHHPHYTYISAEPDSMLTFLKKLTAHGTVLKLLILKDLKLRYYKSKAGNIWYIVQPLIMLAVFTAFIGYIARVDTKDIPYALFFLSGLATLNFFNAIWLRISGSLSDNSHFINKIYFPRIIIPLSTITATFIDFLVMLIFLIALTFYYDYTPQISSLWMIPYLTLLITLFGTGLGFLGSILSLQYKDVKVLIPFAAQLMLFVAPVIYPASLIPERLREYYFINPMAVIIEKLRHQLFNAAEMESSSLLLASVIALATFLFGLYFFYKKERHISEYI